MATATNPSSSLAEHIGALGAAGDDARRAGSYAEARAAFDEALHLARSSLPADDPIVVALLNGRGMVGKYDGDHGAAEADYRRALALARSRPEPDGHRVASILHNLGGLAHARGDAGTARNWAEEGLAMRSTLPDDGHNAVARDQVALAAILVDVDEPAQAAVLAALGRASLVRTHGLSDHDAVAALATVAAARHRLGDLEGAEAAYREALAAKEATLGPDHPELAATLNNLALLCRESGRDDEAVALWCRALAVLDEAGLHDHPSRSRLAANLVAEPPTDPRSAS